MLEDERALVGLIEGKNVELLSNALRQTVAYSVCPLAYSRWGRWRNKEPLVSLLVSPKRLYRLTFSKSSGSPFGIELKIEKTDDKVQMEYELYEYVMKYTEDFHKAAAEGLIDHDSVNPFDWTPMNLKPEDLPPYPTNPERWLKPLMSKNGFLFRTSSDAVKNLLVKYNVAKIPGLASGIPVFVKYLSAVLYHNYEQSKNILNALLTYSKGERRRSADLAAAEKRHLADLEAAHAQSRKRYSVLATLYNDVKRRLGALKQEAVKDPEISFSEAEVGDEFPRVGTEQVVESDTPPTTTATMILYDEDVVHPYIGIFSLTSNNPMVVMHDAGESLYDLVYCPDSKYRSEWQRSTALRSAFLTQVGLSALNLVDKVKLCHNDIRLPNIAVRNGRFCLIDFDFSFSTVTFQSRSAFSPPLTAGSTTWQEDEMEMCYSVAQIAVNVFILDAPTQFSVGEVTKAVSIWSELRDETSPVDSQFQAWVEEKGDPLMDFVSAVRAACNPKGGTELVCRFPADFMRYFVDVLERMLVE